MQAAFAVQQRRVSDRGSATAGEGKHARITIRRACDATDDLSFLRGQEYRHAGKGHHRDFILALPRMRSDVDNRQRFRVLSALPLSCARDFLSPAQVALPLTSCDHMATYRL